MSSVGKVYDQFSKGDVSRNYYAEMKQHEAERASSSSPPLSSPLRPAAATSSALACPNCGEPMKQTMSLRDIMRDIKKVQREGLVFCCDCNGHAFPRAEVGVNKRVSYCKGCEVVVCATCSSMRLAKIRR